MSNDNMKTTVDGNLIKVQAGGDIDPEENDMKGPKLNDLLSGQAEKALVYQTGVEGSEPTLIVPGKWDGSKQTSGHDGILASLRDSSGDIVNDISAVNLDTCSVEVAPGMRTSVQNAIQMGVLTKDSSGHLRESGAASMPDSGTVKAYEGIDTEPQRLGEAPGPIAAGQALTAIKVAQAANPNFTNGLMGVVSDIFHGKENSEAVNRLASDTGLSSGEVGFNFVKGILDGLEAQATAEVGSEPVEWVFSECQPDVKCNIVNRLLAGDRSVFAEIAERYELDNRF